MMWHLLSGDVQYAFARPGASALGHLQASQVSTMTEALRKPTICPPAFFDLQPIIRVRTVDSAYASNPTFKPGQCCRSSS